MFRKQVMVASGFLAILTAASVIAGESYDLTWSTIDAGGGYSAGGNFEIEGTIGQHDAGPVDGGMTGGVFELTGGFWVATQVCYCPGDMNRDGMKDGADIQKFVNCMIAGGSCACADVDAMNGITIDDATVFVDDLLSGGTCP